jgi:hypothetical protein
MANAAPRVLTWGEQQPPLRIARCCASATNAIAHATAAMASPSLVLSEPI